MKYKSNLKFYSNCIFVKGYKRCIIYDLQRKSLVAFENLYYNQLINISKGVKNPFLFKEELKKYDSVLLDILLEKDILQFYMEEEKELFPPLSLNYDSPDFVSNAILEISKNSIPSALLSLEELNNANCKRIQIVFDETINNFLEIHKILNFVSENKLTLIDIQLYTCAPIFSSIERLASYGRLTRVVQYNCKLKKSPFDRNNIDFLFIEGGIKIDKICGIIHPSNFAINIPFFLENNNYNTCLNKKISIDAEGNIKNCPAMERSLGNIKDTTIEEAINKPGFKDLWGIRKDDIDVCKDCEFRYMCTDCRAFIKDTNDIYSQPAKCPYNPYIAKWAWEEGYIRVEQWRAENPDWEKDVVRKPLVEIAQSVD